MVQERIDPCPLVAWMEREKSDQKTLAKKAGVPGSSLSEFIHGSRGMHQKNLTKLSKVTGIPVEVLVLWRLRVVQAEPKRRKAS